jgi:hypothetical protein
VADRWGRDDSRAQCQWWGAGGRGVSEAARFEMDSTIFIDSDGFKNLQTLTDSKSTFSCSKNVKYNMVGKHLKEGSTFLIGIYPDSKWNLN